jgi:alpha-L-rhamnosidase
MKSVWLTWAILLATGVAQGQQVWTAKWIGAPWSTMRDGAEVDGGKPLPIFRRAFEVKGQVTKAELRIAGLGQFEARLGGKNGVQLVGAPGLHEAWTDYRKTVMYESYDLTKAMAPGPHVLAVMLGNGMYNVQKSLMANGKPRYTKFEGSFGAPKLIAELRLIYAGGRTDLIATDTTWKSARGPVVFSSTYGGEDNDARKEQAGWDTVGFNDASWDAAAVVDGPGGVLTAALAPEVAQFPVELPIKTAELGEGRVVYDLGQNFSGVPRVKVQGPAGAVLKLMPGELLKPDGTVSQGSSGGPMWWSYTLAGKAGGEEWTPKFGYYGFRYLQAEWVGTSGKVVSVAGIAEHTAAPETGTFESSNEMLNAIHKLIVEAMHNNEVSLFTDCPHREKLGWLEETHLVAAGVMFDNDVHGLYAATERNIADAQHADGLVPTTAPQYVVFAKQGYGVYDDSPEWGSASVLGHWAAYRFYRDKAELAKNYSTMQAYVRFLESKAQDGIVAYGLGDWYDIGPGGPGFEKNTMLGVTGTLMLYEDAAAMEKIATLLGHAEDAKVYAALAAREKAVFNAHFWNAEKGWYDTGSQTANAMPLALGVVPEERRAAVLAHVIADIHAHDDHVTAGEIGYPYMLRALTEAGRSDVVMAMLMRKDAPSYGSQLAAGATALTEAWDADPKSSQDHFMLGGAEEWFYRGLAGIDFDMSRSVAAERITIRPRVVDGVDWVKCGYASKLGKIESDWSRARGEVLGNVTVPPGAQAKIVLPIGSRLTQMNAKVLEQRDGQISFLVGAGTWTYAMGPEEVR